MRQDLWCEDFECNSGKVVVLQGDVAITSTLLISLALRLQSSGMVTFIDAAATFNPVFVGQYYHKPLICDMHKIMLARPLSAVEFRDLIIRIEQVLQKYKSKVLVISGFDRLFYKEELDKDDLHFMFASVIEEVLRVTKNLDVITIIGVSGIGSLGMVAGLRADVLVNV